MRRLRREACKRSTPQGRLHVKCEMKSIECVNKRVTFKRWVVCTMYYVTRVSLCPFQAESSRGSDVSTHDRGGGGGTLCLAAICSARARLLPPAGWATALTNSRHEGCPKRFVSYDFFSHSVRTSRRQLLGSRYWASTVLSVSGFSLRANPTSFHLCATLLSSYWTSKRSWMSSVRSACCSSVVAVGG
jgi:hypothetical protein